jgi:hypothetical protein
MHFTLLSLSSPRSEAPFTLCTIRCLRIRPISVLKLAEALVQMLCSLAALYAAYRARDPPAMSSPFARRTSRSYQSRRANTSEDTDAHVEPQVPGSLTALTASSKLMLPVLLHASITVACRGTHRWSMRSMFESTSSSLLFTPLADFGQVKRALLLCIHFWSPETLYHRHGIVLLCRNVNGQARM